MLQNKVNLGIKGFEKRLVRKQIQGLPKDSGVYPDGKIDCFDEI